jgi:hypothetical protein
MMRLFDWFITQKITHNLKIPKKNLGLIPLFHVREKKNSFDFLK